ncbi:MAG: polysaccharide biosynthesis tyrosine autokinase [Planctomycetes bacterium]|nr:polysaccharide biosynthesis tyrosine autokinase [Planctomycetota bacterium]
MNDRTEWIEEPVEMAPQGPAFDVLGMLRRRKWLILVGLVAGLALGYLYFSQQRPVYESSAQVHVVKKATPDLPIGGIRASGSYDTTLSDQPILIKSRLVLDRAVQEGDLSSLASFRNSPTPADAVHSGLSAEAYGNVLRLRFQGPNAEDCATVVNAVIDTYVSFLGDTHQNVGKETVQLITEAKDELLKQLSEKEDHYRTFRQESPLLWKDGQGTNIHRTRLAQIEAARSSLLLKQSQVRADLQAIEAALARGDNRAALMLMVGKTEDKEAKEAAFASSEPSAARTIEQDLFPLRLEEEALLERYGPDHPRVIAVRKKMELTRNFHRSRASAAAKAPQSASPAEPVDFLAVYVQSLREQLEVYDEQMAEMNDLFAQEQSDAKALTVHEVQEITFQKEIERTQRLFDAVVQRLEEINLVKDYGGYNVQVLAPPNVGAKVAPSLPKTMAVAGALGLLAGCLLALLVDMADKTFYSPEDIERYLGEPIVGHIPLIATKKLRRTHEQLAPILIAAHRPRSQLAESFRAVRTALYFSTHGAGHKVIQITSPTPSDGKTTLAGNLAVSIAQSGRSVIVVDADARRPQIHKLFSLSRDVGLTSVINGEADLDEAIQSTALENLSVLACGPNPSNPSELLTSPRLKEVLDVLRERFDFVLVDTPPMLAVTDPGVVAPRVDGVLLTLRIKKNVRVNAVRSIEMLSSLGANVLGAVVNGVGGVGRYGYGEYRYGAYRYGYNRYGYGYGGQGYGEYYTEESAEEPSANGASRTDVNRPLSNGSPRPR